MDIKTTTKGLRVRQIADACGVSVQAVYKWEKVGIIPAEYVLAGCEVAGWQVTPHELRPDIYPNPFDGMQRSLCACTEIKEAA